jgi:hypothetical protein
VLLAEPGASGPGRSRPAIGAHGLSPRLRPRRCWAPLPLCAPCTADRAGQLADRAVRGRRPGSTRLEGGRRAAQRGARREWPGRRAGDDRRTRHVRDRLRQHRPRRRARRGLRADRGRVSHRVRRAPAVRVRGFGRRGRRVRRGRRHGGAAAAPGRRADAIDGIRAALESRLAELEKSAQRGHLAQQH